jgi:hypothetical protein
MGPAVLLITLMQPQFCTAVSTSFLLVISSVPPSWPAPISNGWQRIVAASGTIALPEV